MRCRTVGSLGELERKREKEKDMTMVAARTKADEERGEQLRLRGSSFIERKSSPSRAESHDQH
jgi:hypothetical protein